jgi:hypothetical protein
VTEARKELIQAYASAGGKGGRYAEVAMCCAPTEEQGRKTAHRYFRWSLSGWPVLAELPHEEAFAAASEHVPIEAVGKEVSCGPSVDGISRPSKNISPSVATASSSTRSGPDQESFFELARKKILPALRKKGAA